LKRWPSIAIFLIVAASPLVTSADPLRPESPGLTGEAPDFQFLANDGRWKFLHDLRREGHVLLVFEPAEAQLAALECEADSMRGQGVIVIAVFNDGESANWSKIERLKLTFSLLSDPRGELASQFQIAAASGPPHPSWFLVDRDGRVRGLERNSLPATGFANLVAGALQPAEQAIKLKP
jgi:peroxiredoxin